VPAFTPCRLGRDPCIRQTWDVPVRWRLGKVPLAFKAVIQAGHETHLAASTAPNEQFSRRPIGLLAS
jgi:hypothetical protein